MTGPATNQKVPSSAALAQHMIFVCPECGRKSDTQQEWRKHLNETHGYANKTAEGLDFLEIDRKYHECQICQQRIANAHQIPVILQYHRFSHMRYSPYKCRYCPGSYAKKRTLCVHIFRFHRRLINSLERQRMDPKYNREFFINFVCPQCGKNFQESSDWENHIDEAHLGTSVNLGMHRIEGTNDYYCDQCSYTIKNCKCKNELRRHRFSHLPKPDYFKCAFCSFRSAHKRLLFSHFVASHKEHYYQNEKYICRPLEWGTVNLKENGNKLEIRVEQQTDFPQIAMIKSRPLYLQQAGEKSKHVTEEIANIQQEVKIYTEFDEKEMEDICEEMFEEITEVLPADAICNFPDNLRKEMLKYINYLCPICMREFASQPAWRSHVFDQHNLAKDVKAKFRALNVNKTAYVCLVCRQIQRTSKHADLQRHHFQHMPHQDYLKCTICMNTKSNKTRMFQHMKYVHGIRVEGVDDCEDDYDEGVQVGLNNRICLECDEVFDHRLLLQSHIKICPSRLMPIAVGQYDIGKNTRLLHHLWKSSQRIDCTLNKQGKDLNSIKLTYK